MLQSLWPAIQAKLPEIILDDPAIVDSFLTFMPEVRDYCNTPSMKIVFGTGDIEAQFSLAKGVSLVNLPISWSFMDKKTTVLQLDILVNVDIMAGW
jgi:hypothetical protein